MKNFLVTWIFDPAKDAYRNVLQSINWSTLASLGNSRVSKLTILMPVIGYLVIFNSTLSTWLGTTLPKRTISGVPDFWDLMFDRNLVMLYFGLLIFGIGVALYNAVVPDQIKRFPAIEDYISTMEGIGTKNLAIGSFDNIVSIYFQDLDDEERSEHYSGVVSSFPNKIKADFYRIVEEMFYSLDEDFDSPVSEDDERLGSRFRSGSGYLIIDEILNVMYYRRRVDMTLSYAMYMEVENRSKDVYYIEHKVLEYSKPLFRLATFILYCFGLILTAFPSLVTSVIIIKNW